MTQASVAPPGTDVAPLLGRARHIDRMSELTPDEMKQVLPSEALFWTPRHQEQDRASGHVPFLFWLADAVRPSTLLQIGLKDPSGYFALCQAAERLELGTLCFGVAQGTSLPPVDASYASFSVVRPGGLTELEIPDATPIDLLVIQEHLDAELAAQIADLVLPRLSDRAVILISDPQKAVPSALDLILGDQVHSTTLFTMEQDLPGCMLVLWGRQQPTHLRTLVHQKPGMAGWLSANKVFSTLGKGLLATRQLGAMSQQLSLSQERLEQAEAASAPASRTAATQEQCIQTLTDEVADLRQSLATAQAEHGERIEDIAVLTRHFRTEATKITQDLQKQTARGIVLDQQNKKLARQLDEMTCHRDSLLNSTSWRITKPIRDLVRAVRGY
ncbi:hypothetical protein [Paracoccus beibuensis]|uniref:hypothetical protein n=1 Tax=Paracoccus beibuensis TaxID=547602 RepID=UPI00223FF266|nr:hypothetical protein [Paracoccus beibuensis]